MNMNTTLAITLAPTGLFLFFIMYFVGLNSQRYLFGVHASKELRESETARKTTRKYKKQMWACFSAFLILTVPPFFIKGAGIPYIYWMTWFFGIIIGSTVPFGIANSQLKKAKSEYNVSPEGEGEAKPIYAELKEIKKVKIIHFLPQLIIGLLLAISPFILKFCRIDESYFELYAITFISLFIILVIIFVSALWIDRIKIAVINSDTTLNVNYARAKKNIWKNMWIALSWIITGLMLILILVIRLPFSNGLFIGYLILSIIIPLVPMIIGTLQLAQIDKAYRDSIDENFDFDDDRYWIWGQFYYNPKDSRAMVEKRFGTGTTMNMGSKSGKVVTVICALTLLIIPISCVYVVVEEKTPIHIALREDTLITYQLTTKYSIDINEITDITILDEAPEAHKISGSGLDNLRSGLWSNNEYGKIKFFLNPNNGKFIKFNVGEETYIISGYNDEETLSIFSALTAK